MWFIRCRLPFRKDFVQYITKVPVYSFCFQNNTILLGRFFCTFAWGALKNPSVLDVAGGICVFAFSTGFALQCPAAVWWQPWTKFFSCKKYKSQRKTQEVKARYVLALLQMLTNVTAGTHADHVKSYIFFYMVSIYIFFYIFLHCFCVLIFCLKRQKMFSVAILMKLW